MAARIRSAQTDMAKKRSLQDLLADLQSPDAALRAKAASKLGATEGKADRATAANALGAALADPDEKVVRESLCSLWRVDDRAPERFAAIQAILRDKKRRKPTRAQALNALAEHGAAAVSDLVAFLPEFPKEAAFSFRKIGPVAKPADLAPLLPLLDHKKPEVAAAAAEAVAHARVAIPGASEKLRAVMLDESRHPGIRHYAAEGLGELRDPAALDDLFAVAMASRPEEAKRFFLRPGWQAAQAIAAFGESGWPWLKRLLASEKPDALLAAISACDGRASLNEEGTARLLELAEHANAEVATAARAALGNVGDKVLPKKTKRKGDPIDAMVRLASTGDWEARRKGVDALGEFDLPKKVDAKARDKIVAALADALDDADFRVRGQAAWSLSTWGPAAAPALPKLLRMLEDVAGWLDEAERLAGPGARDIVEQGMRDPNLRSFDSALPITDQRMLLSVINDRSRAKAAEAIGEIGAPGATSAAPALRKLLADPDGDRLLVAPLWQALAKIDPGADDVAERAIAGMKSRKQADVNDAMDLAKSMGAKAPAGVVEAIRKHLAPTSKNRFKACVACQGLGEAARPLAREVAALLRDDDDSIRDWAVDALAAQNQPPPDEAIPALLELVADPSLAVAASWAEHALVWGPAFAAQAPARLGPLLADAKAPVERRGAAAIVLRALGDASSEVAAALKELATSKKRFSEFDVKSWGWGELKRMAGE